MREIRHAVPVTQTFTFSRQCQDAPDDVSTTMYVTSAKNETRGICLKCFYIKRGSFGALKTAELIRLMKKSRPLREKLLV